MSGAHEGSQREGAKAAIESFIACQKCNCLRVRGAARIGKSSLINEIERSPAKQSKVAMLERYFALSPEALEGVVLELLLAAGGGGYLKESDKEERKKLARQGFYVSRLPERTLLKLVRALRDSYRNAGTVLICLSIDAVAQPLNSWPVLDADETDRRIKWIIEERRNLGDLIDKSYKPMIDDCGAEVEQTLPLGGWSVAECASYVRQRLGDLVEHDLIVLCTLGGIAHSWAGGHPELMKIVCDWLANGIMLEKNNTDWSSRLASIEVGNEIMRYYGEANSHDVQKKVTYLCRYLSRRALDVVQAGMACFDPIVDAGVRQELYCAGLATSDSHLIHMVRLFGDGATDATRDKFWKSRSTAERRESMARAELVTQITVELTIIWETLRVDTRAAYHAIEFHEDAVLLDAVASRTDLDVLTRLRDSLKDRKVPEDERLKKTYEMLGLSFPPR